jgi:hypothetical protein
MLRQLRRRTVVEVKRGSSVTSDRKRRANRHNSQSSTGLSLQPVEVEQFVIDDGFVHNCPPRNRLTDSPTLKKLS